MPSHIDALSCGSLLENLTFICSVTLVVLGFMELFAAASMNGCFGEGCTAARQACLKGGYGPSVAVHQETEALKMTLGSIVARAQTDPLKTPSQATKSAAPFGGRAFRVLVRRRRVGGRQSRRPLAWASMV